MSDRVYYEYLDKVTNTIIIANNYSILIMLMYFVDSLFIFLII